MIDVIIEGGIVQNIVTDDPSEKGLIVKVIDYDTDGAEEEDLEEIDQGDGTSSLAYVLEFEAEYVERKNDDGI